MSEKLTDADEQLAELFFQCARYERPSTDWKEALLAYKRSLAPVQEGNEPTADMIAAGAWALCDLYAKEGGWCGHKAAEEQAIITWKAMQAAAPHKEGS